MINVNIDIPSWTDILQAFAAVIAVPLTIFTLYKLVSKDKERESEIQSLSTIAGQLTQMQRENEKRHKASKKPHLEISVQSNNEKKHVTLSFKNANTYSSLVNYQLTNDRDDFRDFNAISHTINTNKGEQFFSIVLACKRSFIDAAVLHLDYTTEEGYVFIQDISLWFEDERYLFSPSPIIDKENSPSY